MSQGTYVQGVADPESLNPDLWTLDQAFFDLARRDQVMLDLFYDYTSNVVLYPTWQAYLREHQPATLVTWGVLAASEHQRVRRRTSVGR